uniref:Katanin p60 ATPase-containing subunit A-like 2 n=1 Tax=Strigamia maritima TaxID=126957 RepID=T1J9R5_STRMM
MAEMIDYNSMKINHQTKDYEDQKCMTRKRNLLVLIWEYLKETGYLESAEALQSEVNVDLNRFAVCDNIDLDTILRDFESYYFVRFQKYPRVVKISSDSTDGKIVNSDGKSLKSRSANKITNYDMKLRQRRINSCLPAFSSKSETKNEKEEIPAKQTLCLDGQRLPTVRNNNDKDRTKIKPFDDVMDMENTDSLRLLKPLGLYTKYDDEWKELASAISKDIYQRNPNVKWSDIVGLDEAKHLIKEAVVYPIKYPDIFKGILSPWKGILIYGPPGTGKTLLAKALATECKTTFFNISASSIVSKWRGDSEKLVKILFELARFHAPSTIFIDELDSVMSQRDSGTMVEHEASRRMKTELMVQMDGLNKSDDLVFLLAASNLPWDLDHAILRRLEKRILVDLPDKLARMAMFQKFLPSSIGLGNGTDLNCKLEYNLLSEGSDGYSGAEIILVCKEAAMNKIRKVIDVLEQDKISENDLRKVKFEAIINEDVDKALMKT